MTHSNLASPLSCQNPVVQTADAFDHRQYRSYFVPFGRKKGKLGPQAAKRLHNLLPTLRLPQAADRRVLLQQLDADPDNARLFLEIGFGNGQSLAALAALYAQDRFIGVDVFMEGVAGLIGRLQQAGSTNVRIMAENIYEVLVRSIPTESLDRVIINFPDPWPKRAHHKRRLVQDDFLDLLATRMRPGALLNLATDWPHYAQWMLAVLEGHTAFQNSGTKGDFAPEPVDWVETRFQQKAREAGRSTFHLAYYRKTS